MIPLMMTNNAKKEIISQIWGISCYNSMPSFLFGSSMTFFSLCFSLPVRWRIVGEQEKEKSFTHLNVILHIALFGNKVG